MALPNDLNTLLVEAETINLMGHTKGNNYNNFVLYGKLYGSKDYSTNIQAIDMMARGTNNALIVSGRDLIELMALFLANPNLIAIKWPPGSDNKISWANIKKIAREWFKEAGKIVQGNLDSSGVSQAVTPRSKATGSFTPSPAKFVATPSVFTPSPAKFTPSVTIVPSPGVFTPSVTIVPGQSFGGPTLVGQSGPVQFPTSSQFQPTVSAQFQPAVSSQFQPAVSSQFQPAVSSQFPTSSQFQPAPQAQFQPAPQAQYQPAPQAQYQPAVSSQFQPVPQAQYQPAPQVQFQPAPQAQFQPAHQAQFQPAVSSQFQPAPQAQFQPAHQAQFQPAPQAQFQPIVSSQFQPRQSSPPSLSSLPSAVSPSQSRIYTPTVVVSPTGQMGGVVPLGKMTLSPVGESGAGAYTTHTPPLSPRSHQSMIELPRVGDVVTTVPDTSSYSRSPRSRSPRSRSPRSTRSRSPRSLSPLSPRSLSPLRERVSTSSLSPPVAREVVIPGIVRKQAVFPPRNPVSLRSMSPESPQRSTLLSTASSTPGSPPRSVSPGRINLPTVPTVPAASLSPSRQGGHLNLPIYPAPVVTAGNLSLPTVPIGPIVPAGFSIPTVPTVPISAAGTVPVPQTGFNLPRYPTGNLELPRV
jgi:hypothetical protein